MIGIPYTVKFFIAGHIFLLTGLILAHIIGVSGIFTLIPYHIDFMVYGFGVFTILGGMLHLTPRIIFNMRQKAGKVLSRQKFENLFKVVCISYLIFVFLKTKTKITQKKIEILKIQTSILQLKKTNF
jgi:hypothetical protein